jgi:hypothetical protein
MLCYMQWFAADRCMLLDSKLSKARSDWRGAVQHSIVQRACAADCCSMTWEERWSGFEYPCQTKAQVYEIHHRLWHGLKVAMWA